jgi:hypothetical protein
MSKPTTSYVFTTLDDPNVGSIRGDGTFAEGINNFGEVVGSVETPSGWLGFTYWHGNYATQDVPPTTYETLSQGINNLGAVVGWYNENSVDYAYVYETGHTRRCQHYFRGITLLKGSTT